MAPPRLLIGEDGKNSKRTEFGGFWALPLVEIDPTSAITLVLLNRAIRSL